ncbi:hypothetical protein CCACVL1_21169 [Corchorus capsularis]|uniref:Uncharacterized protein n=1 Tax=Corchorus capsularis TaxID=210143 RepID=A0A1R3H7Z4_COCAP|nr:hypothetical protein CCACVL1_21169 [Corchorus capsularis]
MAQLRDLQIRNRDKRDPTICLKRTLSDG